MFDVIGKRKWFFLFSGLILIPGLIFIILTPITNGKVGLQFSIDYTGGTVWQVEFKNPAVTVADVKAVVEAQGLKDIEVSKDTANVFTIQTKQADLITAPPPRPTATPKASTSAGASASASASVAPTASPTAAPTTSPDPSASVVATASPVATATPAASPSASVAPTAAPTSASAIKKSTHQNGTECDLQIPTAGALGKLATAFQANPKIGEITCTGIESSVGPIISAQLIQQAVFLIFLGSIGILLWIAFRFHDIKMGVTALAALVHDVIVVIGIFAVLGALFGVQIDALFVTAMLTVIGFSVHDTIVVYDRIRENKARHAGEPFDLIVNHSILQTFGRSVNTSLTVVVTLTALLFFAGASIRYFVLALLIGIISGTYSSIFNASPLLVVWQLRDDRRRAARLAMLRSGRKG